MCKTLCKYYLVLLPFENACTAGEVEQQRAFDIGSALRKLECLHDSIKFLVGRELYRQSVLFSAIYRYYIDLTDEMTGTGKKFYGTGYRFSTFYYTLADYMTHKLISRLYNGCGYYYEIDNEMWATDVNGQSIVPENCTDFEITDVNDTEITVKTHGDNGIVCKFVKSDNGWRVDEWSQGQ